MEIKSEIGELVAFYFFQLKVSYNSKLGKGVMGKKLLDLLSMEFPVEPKDLIDFDLLGVRKRDGSADITRRYEEEYLDFPLDLAA